MLVTQKAADELEWWQDGGAYDVEWRRQLGSSNSALDSEFAAAAAPQAAPDDIIEGAGLSAVGRSQVHGPIGVPEADALPIGATTLRRRGYQPFCRRPDLRGRLGECLGVGERLGVRRRRCAGRAGRCY